MIQGAQIQNWFILKVRSSAGPRGMDKMIVSHIEDVTITNEILSKLSQLYVSIMQNLNRSLFYNREKKETIFKDANYTNQL
jgi:hypothetical protein